MFCALLSWLSARSRGGRWLLRIEDIDRQRSRQEFADRIMDDLEWLGLTWDGTPLYQSRRGDIYEHYFHQLQQQQLTYTCYCTRADLLAAQAPHESDGRVVYPGTCRHLPPQPGRSGATRLVVHDEQLTFIDRHYGQQTVSIARDVGDFIIRRKDGGWAYQLAVVVDDALTGVGEVVRGRDLLLSVPQQLYVARLLGLPEPVYAHVPLLCNRAGQRLSKRDRSLDMEAVRRTMTPQQTIGMLACLAGLQPTAAPVSAADLLSAFCWSKIPTADITVGDTITEEQ